MFLQKEEFNDKLGYDLRGMQEGGDEMTSCMKEDSGLFLDCSFIIKQMMVWGCCFGEQSLRCPRYFSYHLAYVVENVVFVV